MNKTISDITRRDVVKGALVAPAVTQGKSKNRAANQIQTENRKAGSDWQLTNVRLTKTNGFRSRVMEGYCSHQSIEAGQNLQIMASCDPPGRFQIEIFRMGYYAGSGARLMTVLGPFEGKSQPDPPVGPNRLRECKWEVQSRRRSRIMPQGLLQTSGPLFIVRENATIQER